MGTIMECRVLMDMETGKPRGIAFVQFDTKAQATAGKLVVVVVGKRLSCGEEDAS